MAILKHRGLSGDQVLASRATHGANTAVRGRRHRLPEIIREIVTEPLFLILVLTAGIYLLLGEAREAWIMLGALGFVSGISLYQETRSRAAVEALRRESGPAARVIREGELIGIPTEEVVVGDILIVEDGEPVAADARILELHDFSVDESLLTGESQPVTKDPDAGEDRIFQGSRVMSGSCTAEVIAVGPATSLGRIGRALEDIEPEKTPLQRQIRSFIRAMVSIGSLAFLVVWGIHWYRYGDLLEGLLQGLTLAMSILPEEIPVAFSTFMAMGAYTLYRQRVIARHPHTVETLGAATVICTDKTGTLTENRMEVAQVYSQRLGEPSRCDALAEAHAEVLEYAMWASETEPFDTMEQAIHRCYAEHVTPDLRPTYRMAREYPLGGSPPRMTHTYRSLDGERTIIACKGAVEGIVQQCDLTSEERNVILTQAARMAAEGHRVLGVARGEGDPDTLPDAQEDIPLTFLGLIAFSDPPKKNIAQVLRSFYDAGIRVKMITGDHLETALAVAQQTGFQTGGGRLSGADVMEMSDPDLRKAVQETHVFARMFPEAKLKVIRALQANGEVVAMTGDGVNDGPALQAAHIGIAMGQRGSEIARSASALILLDDDLARMVDAVALGRRIYENLKKAIRYIISIHIPIILIVLLPLLFGWEIPYVFSPVHVIFLELIMGPTCSIVFEREPIEAGSMQRPPRPVSDSFFSWAELQLSFVQGLAITATCLGLGWWFLQSGHDDRLVRTVIYTTLLSSNIFLTLVNRSFTLPVWTTLRHPNPLMPIALGASAVTMLAMVYIPMAREAFGFQALDIGQLALCIIAGLVGVSWIEVKKALSHPPR